MWEGFRFLIEGERAFEKETASARDGNTRQRENWLPSTRPEQRLVAAEVGNKKTSYTREVFLFFFSPEGGGERETEEEKKAREAHAGEKKRSLLRQNGKKDKTSGAAFSREQAG